MATFDGWDSHLYGYSLPNGQDTLAHFRTKGSKNGVRRYQNEDGTWTPLGLKERKAREGWGDGRQERKAARQAARSERKAARAERIRAYKEERRKNNPKTMTDEELRAKIERAKLEQEYREISKSPARVAGEKLVGAYLRNKENRDRRREDKENKTFEMLKLKEQTKQAEIRKAETEARAKADTAKAGADKARAETDRLDIEKGTRMKQLKLDTKRANATLTIRGGLKRMANTMLTARGDRKAATKQGRAFVKDVFRNRKKVDRYNSKLDPWQTPMDHDPDEWTRRPGKSGKGRKGGGT